MRFLFFLFLSLVAGAEDLKVDLGLMGMTADPARTLGMHISCGHPMGWKIDAPLDGKAGQAALTRVWSFGGMVKPERYRTNVAYFEKQGALKVIERRSLQIPRNQPIRVCFQDNLESTQNSSAILPVGAQFEFLYQGRTADGRLKLRIDTLHFGLTPDEAACWMSHRLDGLWFPGEYIGMDQMVDLRSLRGLKPEQYLLGPWLARISQELSSFPYLAVTLQIGEAP